MKLWEAIKELEEKPYLKFTANPGEIIKMERDGIGNVLVNDVDGYIRLPRYGWDEEDEPITWQDALLAWANGKKVSYCYKDETKIYSFTHANLMMCEDKINNAVWYLGDGQN